MESQRKRILFLAEGATMAHFVRLLSLADTLDITRYDVHFHAPGRFAGHLGGRRYSIGDLPTMPGEQFLENIAKGSPAFPTAVLRRYVQCDRELIQRVQPDLVIGDMRLSLPISARLENTPCAVLINAYWSPFTKRRSILPELPLTRIVPPRLLGGIYRITEPLAYSLHIGHMNRLRKEFGIAPLLPDFRHLYTDGDYVLYADIPEFVPSAGLPATHFYVGTCPWAPHAARPEWWNRMVDDPKPKVFVTLGSSGPLVVLPALLQALAKLPVSVVISTSGRETPGITPAMYSADLLPFTDTAQRSAVVVSHGGSGGLYPAMAAGTPVLGIPSNADQHLSTAVLEENGAGLGVRVEEASEKRLSAALEKLLFDPKYATSARHWAEVFTRYDSGAMFEKFLNEIF
ncbi:MAG TPA: nucleotide disphospho-sugar-binding domain-containing protein [Edaphobacter sp.]|nr:nucleotide disphospho-sugar-binding domain-containing protein [Edaphobacter sp.]